jgi:hypothetical protein
MTLAMKNRLEGTAAQQRAMTIRLLATRILAAKRAAQKA